MNFIPNALVSSYPLRARPARPVSIIVYTMNAVMRGIRNAFRNPLRTIPVISILGISLGLVVVMLAARSAVDKRIAEVKASVGNTITVSPAGARGFLGGGEPLTNDAISKVAGVANVTGVDATIDAQLVTDTDTNLQSPIEAGTLGNRQGRAFRVELRGGSSGTSSANDEMSVFTPPIQAVGTNSESYAGEFIGSNVMIESGSMIDPASDANEAVVGKALAEKNTLSVGSTFTAYNTTITVRGVYDAGNDFANNSVIFPLSTLQRLSDQSGQITSMVARVNSVDNLATATTAVQSALGDAADVTSSEESVQSAIEPLENIRTIATTSLFGALIASTIVTLLTMVIIVRERRREIAVLKAIGAGDGRILTQFMTESVSLTLCGSVIATVLGIAFSNPILAALVKSNADGPTFSGGPGEGPGRGAIAIAVGGFRAVRGAVENVTAAVDLQLVLYGLLAALLVAVIGSSFPAWLISKIRPAEVLRSE